MELALGPEGSRCRWMIVIKVASRGGRGERGHKGLDPPRDAPVGTVLLGHVDFVPGNV